MTLDLPIGAIEEALEVIYDTTKTILKDDKKPNDGRWGTLSTLPVFQAVVEKYLMFI